MIVISIAVLAILLLIACVGWWSCYRYKQLVNALEYQLHEERLRVSNLKAELAERPLPAPVTEEEPETGNFVKRRAMRRATPETYRNIFDLDINGQRVLENLTIAFCKDAYASQDQGGERETCYRLGQHSVINFIVRNINTANSLNYKEQSND